LVCVGSRSAAYRLNYEADGPRVRAVARETVLEYGRFASTIPAMLEVEERSTTTADPSFSRFRS